MSDLSLCLAWSHRERSCWRYETSMFLSGSKILEDFYKCFLSLLDHRFQFGEHLACIDRRG